MSEKIQFTREEKLHSWQYQRIMEILEDYWLDEPEETYVEVAMYFEKRRGKETQTKHIRWGCPSTVDPEAKNEHTIEENLRAGNVAAFLADWEAGKAKEETMFVLNPEWGNMKEDE